MVGLTHNERCLIYNLRLEKHWGSTRITRMFLWIMLFGVLFSNKSTIS